MATATRIVLQTFSNFLVLVSWPTFHVWNLGLSLFKSDQLFSLLASQGVVSSDDQDRLSRLELEYLLLRVLSKSSDKLAKRPKKKFYKLKSDLTLSERQARNVDDGIFFEVWETKLGDCPPAMLQTMASLRLFACAMNEWSGRLRVLLQNGEGALMDAKNVNTDDITPTLVAARQGEGLIVTSIAS